MSKMEAKAFQARKPHQQKAQEHQSQHDWGAPAAQYSGVWGRHVMMLERRGTK